MKGKRLLLAFVFVFLALNTLQFPRQTKGLEPPETDFNGAETSVDERAVQKNLELSNESILSEYITTVLTKAGLERPKVHSKLRDISVTAKDSGQGLIATINEDDELKDALGSVKLDVEEYFNTIREVSDHIVQTTVREFQDATK